MKNRKLLGLLALPLLCGCGKYDAQLYTGWLTITWNYSRDTIPEYKCEKKKKVSQDVKEMEKTISKYYELFKKDVMSQFKGKYIVYTKYFYSTDLRDYTQQNKKPVFDVWYPYLNKSYNYFSGVFSYDTYRYSSYLITSDNDYPYNHNNFNNITYQNYNDEGYITIDYENIVYDTNMKIKSKNFNEIYNEHKDVWKR